MRLFRPFLLITAALALLVGAGVYLWEYWPPASRILPRPKLSRPYGMAPSAFDALVRACNDAQIHPYRIGQTIGDHPLSVGYHFRDGVVTQRGQKIDYTAAVDLGTHDLTRVQLNRFLESLAKQGFAAFYREKGKWRGREHIHAIYGPLRMKPQLQGQMREWETKRQRDGKQRYRWQTRWKRNWH
ncbi:MAG TPA: hypothetical protein VGB45_11270 [Abditibacterium sp.]